MSETGLAIREGGPMAVMPVMNIQQAVTRYEAVIEFVGKLMKIDTDYGAIPGAGDKRTLLKPGAEKLCTFFGLSKRFILVEKTEDWTGVEHGGEPFFYYLYRCALYAGDTLVAESDASANSFESKYRYRKGERVCPDCGQAAILKSKNDGEGFFCWRKKGGCGATFSANDESITGQVVGRIVNVDVCDQVNTLQKMAQKRALVGATLLAVNASEFFTQDMEDFTPEPAGMNDTAAPRSSTSKPTNGKPKQQSAGKKADVIDISPELSGLDKVLRDWAVKTKGERGGLAYFKDFLSKQSAKDKEAFASKQGIKWNETGAVEAEPDAIDAEIDSEMAAALDSITGISDALANAGMKNDDIRAEIVRLLPKGCDAVTDCTPRQIDEIITGLELKLGAIKK